MSADKLGKDFWRCRDCQAMCKSRQDDELLRRMEDGKLIFVRGEGCPECGGEMRLGGGK